MIPITTFIPSAPMTAKEREQFQAEQTCRIPICKGMPIVRRSFDVLRRS